MRPKVERAVHSVVNEWLEAPWFVILTIAATAFLGPGILRAVIGAIGGLISF